MKREPQVDVKVNCPEKAALARVENSPLAKALKEHASNKINERGSGGLKGDCQGNRTVT